MSTPVKTIAILVARRGMAEAQSIAQWDGGSEPGRAGKPAVNLWRDHADGDRFVLEEAYADDVAVATHRATPHYERYRSRISDIAERTVMLLDPLEVA